MAMREDVYQRYLMLLEMFDTQKEIADLTGISTQVVSAIKKGKIENPTLEVLVPLGNGLGCSIDWLLLGRGSAFPVTHPDYSSLKQRAEKNGMIDDMFPEEPKSLAALRNGFLEGDLSQSEFVGLLRTLKEMISSWITMYETKRG